MPCSDSQAPRPEDIERSRLAKEANAKRQREQEEWDREQKRRLDTATRLLCQCVREDRITTEALEWYDQHEKEDRARRAKGGS